MRLWRARALIGACGLRGLIEPPTTAVDGVELERLIDDRCLAPWDLDTAPRAYVVAIGIEIAGIASVEPAIAKLPCIGFRITFITSEDIGAADCHFAGFSRWQAFADRPGRDVQREETVALHRTAGVQRRGEPREPRSIGDELGERPGKAARVGERDRRSGQGALMSPGGPGGGQPPGWRARLEGLFPQAASSRPLAAHFRNDDLVRSLRIGLIEHHAVVPGPLEHGRQRHDADGRKPHHADVAIRGPCLVRQGVELRVANVNQEYSHMSDGQAFSSRRLDQEVRSGCLPHGTHARRARPGLKERIY